MRVTVSVTVPGGMLAAAVVRANVSVAMSTRPSITPATR
jgi:hypothetical protein